MKSLSLAIATLLVIGLAGCLPPQHVSVAHRVARRDALRTDDRKADAHLRLGREEAAKLCDSVLAANGLALDCAFLAASSSSKDLSIFSENLQILWIEDAKLPKDLGGPPGDVLMLVFGPPRTPTDDAKPALPWQVIICIRAEPGGSQVWVSKRLGPRREAKRTTAYERDWVKIVADGLKQATEEPTE